MKQASVAILVMSLAGLLLLWGAARAARRVHSASDFFVGGRRGDAWSIALSHTANAMPPWLLLIVCSSAFAWGLSAIWLWAGLLLGFALNWFFVALRLRAAAGAENALSVLQILSFEAGERLQVAIRLSASAILLVALLLLAAAQLHAAVVLAAQVGIVGGTFVVCVGIGVMVYVLIGGYPAASQSEVATLLIMLAIALFLPMPAVLAADGTAQLGVGFAALGPAANDWFAGRTGVVALAFAIGVSATGFALAGQPHALSRFMAARDARTLQQARWISLGCVLIVPWMMLLCGWCAKVLYTGLNDPSQALFAISNRTLPPWLAAVVITLAICALLASMGGPLLAAAASLTLDLRSMQQRRPSLALAHIALLLCAGLTLILALYAEDAYLERSMLALGLMGSTLGPLLLVRLGGKRVRPGSTLGALWSGALLTLVFHLLPDAPGDFLERVVPFVAALGIALTGGERRRNPDRADRNEQTVHDRVPI
jgi:sodium/proline symporter